MEIRPLGLIAGVAFLGLTSAMALAQAESGRSTPAAPAASQHGSFCGVVVKLAEGSCIGVKASAADQPLYDITSAKPAPTAGQIIAGSGTPGGMSFCMEGIHLTQITWHAVAACPLAKKSMR
jgi:hypothetical protein